jgi:hypothetical protein
VSIDLLLGRSDVIDLQNGAKKRALAPLKKSAAIPGVWKTALSPVPMQLNTTSGLLQYRLP